MTKRNLKCVERANTNPYKLNQIGKEGLARDIVDEMDDEEINKFVEEWGYEKD